MTSTGLTCDIEAGHAAVRRRPGVQAARAARVAQLGAARVPARRRTARAARAAAWGDTQRFKKGIASYWTGLLV